MAYASSPVANISDLLTFIQNTCTANGWTLSGSILHKGSVYVEIISTGGSLTVRGGTGKDGSNNLTGAGPITARAGVSMLGQAFTYPATVEIHINTSPDEVYVALNYATSFYQFAAWGLSDVPGLTGTGVWYYAHAGGSDGNFVSNPVSSHMNGDYFAGTGRGSALFWATSGINGATSVNAIHSDVDSAGWQTSPVCHLYLAPLLQYSPNAWNGEAVLLPYHVYVSRASSKHTLVADLKHVRNCRIDYHEPGDIITLGSDQWKIYPWYRKDSTSRDGTVGTHSGTLGYAVRYTGP